MCDNKDVIIPPKQGNHPRGNQSKLCVFVTLHTNIVTQTVLLVDTITRSKFTISLFVLMMPLEGGLHIKVTWMGQADLVTWLGQGDLVTWVGQDDMGGTG